jgi:hypothetical protein
MQISRRQNFFWGIRRFLQKSAQAKRSFGNQPLMVLRDISFACHEVA